MQMDRRRRQQYMERLEQERKIEICPRHNFDGMAVTVRVWGSLVFFRDPDHEYPSEHMVGEVAMALLADVGRAEIRRVYNPSDPTQYVDVLEANYSRFARGSDWVKKLSGPYYSGGSYTV